MHLLFFIVPLIILLAWTNTLKEKFTNDQYYTKYKLNSELPQHMYFKYLEDLKSKKQLSANCDKLAKDTCTFTNPYMFMPSKQSRPGESCITDAGQKIKHVYTNCYNFVHDCCKSECFKLK